eukprot:CAMPEP_0116864862 /NCGR_PEP_ID=MMETSP0418-20121206/25061_1 /TAXON_ID=1158023 /ORGANISM="Astrosyne radiata, Strain 13vi08-1A" /LENGTH=133 /DNA_ID=CAMNT_0004500137 /DNA_START=145 /DNA_END=546 /DNA_ORIENTATION=+
MSRAIPVMTKPVNYMEVGPNGNNLAAAAVKRHPVDTLQQQQQQQSHEDFEQVRLVYGSGLAMRLATERQLGRQLGGRLPGMEGAYGERSNVMLETLMGTDTTLSFEDYMMRPEDQPVASVPDPHTAMARKLNL